MLLLTREDEKFAEGREKEKKRVAVQILKDGEPLAKIIRYTELTEKVIRSIATARGLVVS